MQGKRAYNWIEIILGVLLIVAGVLAFVKPGSLLSLFSIFIGAAIIVSGVGDLVFYFQMNRASGFGPTSALIGGIAAILIGILFLSRPRILAVLLGVLFIVWLLTHCVSRLANVNFVRAREGNGMYWFTIITNALGIALAIILLFRPLMPSLALTYALGAYHILLGVNSILSAVMSRKR